METIFQLVERPRQQNLITNIKKGVLLCKLSDLIMFSASRASLVSPSSRPETTLFLSLILPWGQAHWSASLRPSINDEPC